ncbi:MAG: 2-oxo acid dehydrogenase subunit E2 [Pontiellaceae bacterium]|nr:2-oxo acid dehydrogenase subunit E2 [Pontiellaceae bacterium]MBN2784463.1 2-oxo acid dehydrogenase subunit E2 [Pontiellaceae bacterium]
MALEFKLPELGENIESGDVVSVLVAAGDIVSEGQSLLEIEAGKASMEIPSPASGTIKEVHVAVGDSVGVGQLAFTIEAGESTAEVPTEEKAEPAPVVPPKEEPAPAAEAPVAAPAPVAPAPAPKADAPAVPAPSTAKAVSAAPNVRRLARELGIDIHQVQSTGAGGRISLEDVKYHAKSSLENGGGRKGGGVQGATRVEKMSGIRKATMQHMAYCWATIPHVTQHDMADITDLEMLRKKFAPKAEAAGAKLTITAMLVNVVAAALRRFPNFNCSIDADKAEIIYKDFYNIGIAVDTDKGLMVPVVRDADSKNMIEVAQDLGEIARKARAGQIALADLQGGTFTISNLGGIGGSYFTPIVNSPEVAILGVSRAVKQLDAEGNVRLMMPLSLSYDHRIIDGADGARFLRWVIEALEEPLLLALEG